jgi:hypothetical protein
MRPLFLVLGFGALCSTAGLIAEDRRQPAAASLENSQEERKTDKENTPAGDWFGGMGINYPLLLEKAAQGEDRSLRLLIVLGRIGEVDTSAADEFTYDMHQTAVKAGDRKFAAALAQLPGEIAKDCYERLCYELTEASPDTPEAAAAVGRVFPETLQVIRTVTLEKPLWKQSP